MEGSEELGEMRKGYKRGYTEPLGDQSTRNEGIQQFGFPLATAVKK